MSNQWIAAAARNNAEWCDALCRSHGLVTRWDDDAWTSSTRTPPFYPDAVTLVANLSASDLLSRIDASPGCSIKDSFATLDLTPHGFRVLFVASWIVRTAAASTPAETSTRWTVVRDGHDLAKWERAWGGDVGPSRTFRAELLDDPAVVVLAGFANDDQVVAGVILNRSATVVGVSNAFGPPSIDASGWLAVAADLFPSMTLVGYESDDQLELARRQDFEIAGPLRVWINDA